jgi:Domain of unknown function (DUF4920)
MLSTRLWLVLAVGALANGCESGDPSGVPAKAVASVAAPTPPPTKATPSTKFGAPLGNSPVVPLADIVRETGKYAKTTVKTEGQVTAVCQAAGCWMEISDPAGQAHVRMGGHSFLVPKSASGRRARVEGTVLPKPDNGECEQEALEATGRTVKVELDATGVELL